jgi:hypothetical protein
VGSINKNTITVRNALIQAFDKMGGVPALVRWGKRNPDLFYRLWAKLLPVQISGLEGGPIILKIQEEIIARTVQPIAPPIVHEEVICLNGHAGKDDPATQGPGELPPQ